MDWILPVVLYITVLTTLNKIQCAKVNPYNGFIGTNYEPTADFNINQGAYMNNMPVASIYPMMADESFHTMVGLPSIKPQGNPYLNPLLDVSQTTTQNKRRNTRNNNQRHSNSNPQYQHGNNGPHKNRGVTLDVRGGGYKLEKHQSAKPYKAPITESSNRNTQRYNNGRNGGRSPSNGRNTGRQRNSSPRNRKPNQSQRGPTMKNPHYNMKFETSMPSMPPNVEFVNPENVLPLHPRIYKQFLQQNKQFAAQYQNLNKPNNQFKSHNGGNYRGSHQGNKFNNPKPSASKPTRQRGNPASSSFAQFSNFAPNFQLPGGESSSSGIPSQFGFFEQQSGGKLNTGLNPEFDDFFKQDPSFYASLGQTSEGQAILSQFQPQIGGSHKPSKSKSQRPSFTNKPPQQTYSNTNSPTYVGSAISSFPGGTGSHPESGIPSISTNYFKNGQGFRQNDAGNVNPNQSPSPDYQQMMMYYQQQMQQQQQPQQQLPQQYSPPSGQTHFQGPSSGPNYLPNQQYSNAQTPNNPFINEYQYTQGQSSHFQDNSQTFGNTPESATYSKTKTIPYDKSNYPNSYQASHKDIKSQMPDIHAPDQTGYTLPPFVHLDPLATVENNNQEAHDYYSYHPTPGHHKSPLYTIDQKISSYSNGGLHEISPYSDEKTSADHTAASLQSNSNKPEPPLGYMTPEQLFAPQSTGLQSEAKFGYPSAHGGLSQSPSSMSKDSAENEAAGSTHEEHAVDGGERAALHEYSVTYDPFSHEGSEKLKMQNNPSMEEEPRDSSVDAESDEKLHESILEFQKLFTKAPKNTYMVEPTDSTHKSVPTRFPVLKKVSPDEMRNHKTTPSYMFQYAPAEKSVTKVPPTWQSWKPNASRYHLPLPENKEQVTTTTSTTTSTTPSTTTTQETTTVPTSTSTAVPYTKVSFYHEPETPVCARQSNLTYCLQDPEYPKEKIKEAIEKNRHPLDHFLVDISASTNVVDDSLAKVFENSVPLQSTEVSYSFEGKAIAPAAQAGNVSSAGCSSSSYYGKPLRAINTAGLWRTIVNVEFEETGANYTQTVRLEECSNTPGYVATCGTETISACLQNYKLHRLLAWEEHRGFYIDAFLLPISCFCGTQQTNSS